jgi:hypothetical protein
MVCGVPVTWQHTKKACIGELSTTVDSNTWLYLNYYYNYIIVFYNYITTAALKMFTMKDLICCKIQRQVCYVGRNMALKALKIVNNMVGRSKKLQEMHKR